MTDIPDDIGEHLRLDPDSGHLFWQQPRQAIRVGDRAGTLDTNGYVMVKFRGRRIAAHRIVWFLATGQQPPATIDHRDGDKANNLPVNLRAATPTLNNANWRARGSLPKGTTLHKSGRFQASVKRHGKSYYLGLFDTAEEAHAAYVRKASELFGEFVRAA
jgi:hypothetical protein